MITASRLWAPQDSQSATTLPTSPAAEALYDKVHQLPGVTEKQRLLAARAQGYLSDIARTRMLLYEQQGSSISTTFLAVVVFWLTIMFVSFGIFAPRNLTVMITFLLCAVSVSGAIFLVVELDKPFGGLIEISSAPLQNALALLGK